MIASEIKAPYLTYDDIRIRAENFYNLYNPNDEVPVRILEIAEIELKIQPIPYIGLERNYGIDGFITCDFKEIYIDYNTYYNDSYENRLRFTFAHELGHMFSHREIYELDLFRTPEEWKKFVNEIDPKQYGYLEQHANSFAGLVLVPKHHLEDKYRDAIDMVKNEGFDFKSNIEIVNQYVSTFLQEIFKVSSKTIEIRIEKENLANRY